MKAHKIIVLTISSAVLSMGVLSTTVSLKPSLKVNAELPNYTVYFDMNGHGTNKDVPVTSGTTVAQAVRDNYSPSDYSDGDYYLIGFNEGHPLSDSVEGLNRFYKAAAPFQNMQITRSLSICAGWAKIPENPNVFNKIKNTTISKVDKISKVGDLYFSNMQIPSYWINTKYVSYKVEIETSELVNVEDPSEKVEFDIFNDVCYTTDMTVGTEAFKIYENEKQSKLFSKNSGTKDYVYIDAPGRYADFTAIGDIAKDKLLIVNAGDNSLDDKAENAKDYGVGSLLIANDNEDVSVLKLLYEYDFCIGSILNSAVSKIKETGQSSSVNGITVYTGTLNVGKAKEEIGIPFEGEYRLNYGEDCKSEMGSLYIKAKNPESMKLGSTYQFSITYSVTALDNGGDFTQANLGVDEETIVTITPKERTPDKPDNPDGSSQHKGLPAGAIVGIVIGSVLILALAGSAIFWFVIKKKSFKDLGSIFKKKQ